MEQRRRNRNESVQLKRKFRRQVVLSVFSILILLILIFSVIKLFIPHDETPSPSPKEQTKSISKEQKPKKKVEAKTKLSETVMENEAIDKYLISIGFSGTAYIVREGKVVLNKGYKEANRENKVQNNPDTVYFVGSAQKAFTATAILQLAERGKLKIDDPINKYLPDFPNGKNITLRNFLTHTSGINGHKEGQGAITPQALIDDIKKQGIARSPGKWYYMDSNYTVLSYLVEKLSGMPLAEYLTKYVFKPAGMKHVGFYQTFKKEPYPSVGYYVAKDGNYTTPAMPDLSQLFGVGNMYMSASDMQLFDKALFERKLINDASFREMFKKGSSSGYGFGFYVDPGSYNNHGILNGWNISNSFSHTGKTYVMLFSNVQNNISSFGKVNNEIYKLLNKTN
ncbi:serine hydrolase [Listeria sp. PSOL-1]|uniref:serine hydrolase domain-containing protein n=1 Tax=Listeria sp. PSOL-1 TaxID=1844999 RepID=UPI0013D1F554|nr:serine hydrolase domain-containing protein [Listeria sp. PSOL-1]